MTPRFGRVRVQRSWAKWLARQERVPAVVRDYVAHDRGGRLAWSNKWSRVG